MKRIPKEITLKQDTIKDINIDNIDLDLFIERINNYLEKANYLINNKMDNMDSIELYNSLREVFNIYFEPNDYLKILSLKNNKHYSKYINIKTRMYDENDYNVSLFCAATNKVKCENDSILDLTTLRKLTNSEDLIVLKESYKKEKNTTKKRDNYESFLYNYININNKTINEDNELYPYASEILKKDLLTKYVLFDLKEYVDEVLHQVKEITRLSTIKNDDYLASIGMQYKKAYDKATNNGIIPKKEKISVRHHQKSKKKKTNNYK